MATKISLDCSDNMLCEDKEKGKIKCQYHQLMCRKLLLLSVVFVCLIFLQFYWNFRLNKELHEVRNDIDYLLSKCQKSTLDSAAEYAYFDSDVTKHYANQENNDAENNKVMPQEDQLPLAKFENSDLSNGGNVHDVVKRSSVTNLFRKQRKAIAVHISAKRPTILNKAGQPSFNPNPSVPVPGKIIKSWDTPEDANNSKFNLCHLNTEGYIKVLVDGYYFIYGQVIFTTNSSTTMSAQIGVGFFGTNTFTKCLLTKHDTKQSWTTCNVSGVKKLERGDAISLAVLPMGVNVYMAPEYTYFGAVLVGLS